MNPTILLTQAVQLRLLPYLVGQGFAQQSLADYERKNSQIRVAFPFGRLKRWRGDKLDIIEIQFDKRGSPKFVINVGIAPPEGVRLPWASMSQEEVEVAALPDAYRLYRNVENAEWFGLGWLPFRRQASAENVADDAVERLREVLAWFETGRIGSHMRKYDLPIPRVGDATLDA